MEERSAAAFEGGGSSDEEGSFGEGYEAEELLLAVRHDDLQHEEPRLRVTRAQKRLAGEVLALPTTKCKHRDCLYCTAKTCLEDEGGTSRTLPCIFCSPIKRPDLCVRRGNCTVWSVEQCEVLSVARGVQEALMREQAVQQIILPATATSTPRKEASTDVSGEKEEENEESKDGEDLERAILMQIEERSGTKPRKALEKQKDVKGPMSIASRPFVERIEESDRYILRLDLNQLTYPFKPEEFQMSTKENKLLVKASHEPAAENTPTRSKDAKRSWSQEFELPARTSNMVAQCLITQDNLAVLCFEEKRAPTQDEERAIEAAAHKAVTSRERAGLGSQEGEGEHTTTVIPREGEENDKREWQKRKMEEIAMLQDELERSFQTADRLGAQAISPEEMEVGEDDQKRNEVYRDRWKRANMEWRGQGIPQYPEGTGIKTVHWPEERNMEESFYSLTETPLTTRASAPGVSMPQRPILMPAKLHYLDKAKPWDRGAELNMFRQGPGEPRETKGLPPPGEPGRPSLPDPPPFSPRTPSHQRGPFEIPTTHGHPGVRTAPHHLSSSQLTPGYADLQFPSNQPFASRPLTASHPERASATQGTETEPKRRRERQNEMEQKDNTPQLAEVLTLLTDRLTSGSNNRSSEKNSSLKLPSITLPRCRFDSSNQTSARQWYLWKHSLFTCVAQHKLDTKVLLVHYATDSRLLPTSMQEAFQNSDTLEEALETIGSRFPPLHSLHAELIKEILSFPPLEASTEKAKILRCSKLLATLEDFLRFFKGEPSLDLSRDKILFILHNLAGQQEYKQEILREVTAMDEKRRQGQLYADSLKEFLLRYRLLYVDLHSALSLVGNHTSTKHRSAAVKTREKIGEDTGRNKENCPLCLTKPHRAWACWGELKKVAAGTRTLPANVCAACLDVKKSGHPPKCSIVRSKNKGVFYLYQNLCPKCSINIKICPCQEKAQKRVDPDQSERIIKSGSAAFRVKILQEDVSQTEARPDEASERGEKEQADEGSEGDEDEEGTHVTSTAAVHDDLGRAVIFLSEEILILGHDNQTRKIIVSYDSHSSSHHCTRDLGNDFNWAEEGDTRPVAMLTVAGQITSHMLVFKIKVLTLQGILNVTALEATWSDSKDEPQLDRDLAKECDIALPCCEADDQEPLPRLILGCGEITKFPKRIPTPSKLAAKHSKLAVFSSPLTGNLLVCGQLDHN